jgi:hypothetical protein
MVNQPLEALISAASNVGSTGYLFLVAFVMLLVGNFSQMSQNRFRLRLPAVVINVDTRIILGEKCKVQKSGQDFIGIYDTATKACDRRTKRAISVHMYSLDSRITIIMQLK